MRRILRFSGIVRDPDVEALFLAAGITDGTHKNAVSTLIRLFKNNLIWDDIIDLELLLSGASTIAQAMVKAKYPGSFSTCLNNGPSAFTDANYSHALGVRNTSGNRKLDTQIIMADHGLSKDNFCIMTAVTDDVTLVNNSVMIDNKVTGGAAVFFQKSGIGMSGGGQATLHAQNAGVPYIKCINSVDGLVSHYNNFTTHFLPTTVANVTFDTSISLLGGRNFGAVVGVNAAVGFNMIAHPLTKEKIDIVVQGVRDYFVAIGRSTDTKECLIYGDSNGVGAILGSGNGPTVITNRWAYNLCVDLGLKEANASRGGATYRTNGVAVPSIPGGYPNRAECLKYNILNGGYVILCHGTNDCTADSGDGVNYGDFETKLITQINELISFGMPLNKIVVCSIPPIGGAVHSVTKQSNYRGAAFNAADATGVVFSDNYNYILDNGGTAANVGPDNLHLNNTGHGNYKTCTLNAIIAAS